MQFTDFNQQVTLLRYAYFEDGHYFDRLAWSIFEGRVSLFVFITVFGLNFRTLFVVFILWLRMRTKEFKIRLALSWLVLSWLFYTGNWTVLRMVLPIEVTKWLVLAIPSIKEVIPFITTGVTMPNEVIACLDNLSTIWLMYTNNLNAIIAIAVPNQFVLYFTLRGIKKMANRFHDTWINKEKINTPCAVCHRDNRYHYQCEHCDVITCVNCTINEWRDKSECTSCKRTHLIN